MREHLTHKRCRLKETSKLKGKSMSICSRVGILFVALLLITTLFAESFQKGKIVGVIKDAESGEPLIGANVVVKGFPIGAASNYDGKFEIENIPPGKIDLEISMIGYSMTTVQGIVVSPGKVTRLQEIHLIPEAIEGEEVVITARFIQNTDAALLAKQRESDVVSDGISAEAISRSGSSRAADAMRQVTGASVVDGKYVYIRGLGERYASTQINGVELPSADPEKRSFQMDLIPAALLDNIVVVKTFTPDQPGNFSGGVVNMGLKSFPDKFSLRVNTGLSWNSLTTFQNDFLTYPGSGTDWLGFDNGTRSIPDLLKAEDLQFPSEFETRNNPEKAQLLDKYTKAFSPVMGPSTATAPINNSFGISLGNQIRLFNRTLGYYAGITYQRKASFYDNGEVGRWKLTGKVAENDSLSRLTELNDTKGATSVLWGGMATLSYKLAESQQVRFNFLHTQNGTATARYLIGPWPEQNVEFLESRALTYQERSLNSYLLSGKHEFDKLGDLLLEWSGSLSNTVQDEPDGRFFANTIANRKIGGRDTTVYQILTSILPRPARYFRNLHENNQSFNLSMTKPFQVWRNDVAQLKFGVGYLEKKRTFKERLFEYWKTRNVDYDGNPANYFSSQNVGIIGFDSTSNRYEIGNYIQESSNKLGGNYHGSQFVRSAFVMLDVPVTNWMRIIGGARFEAARMKVTNDEETGILHDDDLLPSATAILHFARNMNLRLAYGKTLARPNFREKAPYANFEFVGDVVFNGNVNLKRTLIDNYDLRWEWFPKPGEMISFSLFTKRFKNPIERVIDVTYGSEGGLIFFDNTPAAQVQGIEFEARKTLSILHRSLKHLLLSTNLSLIHSEVDIPEAELVLLRALDPNASSTRPLQGQSPFLLNVGLFYTLPRYDASVNLFYNIFGERMSEVSTGGTPNVFEQPRHDINLTMQKKLIPHLSAKIAVRNLLDEKHEFVQHFKGVDYLRRAFDTGRTVSFSLSYNFQQ